MKEENLACIDICTENHNSLNEIIMLNQKSALKLADIFKVLGDSTRINILYLLMHGSLCVCEIANRLNMGQSAISHQLRILRNARLVKYRKDGKSVIYSLDDEHVVDLFKQGLDHVEHI